MVIRAAEGIVFAAKLDEIRERGCLTKHIGGHTLVFFAYGDNVYAVDNRCPHMGFPLDKGTVHDGILTCHWHHARFDLASGGTFDQWADDVTSFPVEIREDDVWVDLTLRAEPLAHHRKRLHDGLERSLSLVIAKAAINLLDGGVPADESFRIGVEFGTRYRWAGWGQGLTILACMQKLLPNLNREDYSRALFHGLSAVATDSSGAAPRFMVSPLPLDTTDIPTLKRWFRQFIEVRDDEGAERCVISAIRAGADDEQMADMMFAAATDHRYIQIGHPLDFTNKTFETLDIIGWEHAELVLSSLTHSYAVADRMEESNAWRHPIDLIEILDQTFDVLADVVKIGRSKKGSWQGQENLVPVLLGDDPQAIADSLLDALREGRTEAQLAGVVTVAAAMRVARFHTSNDFSDWDTALHTFTFANAVQHGLRRVNSFDLLRGVFDAAMSIYLDRFLNIPAARIPEPTETVDNPLTLLDDLEALLNQQQQVNQAGSLVALYLHSGGNADALMAKLGSLLLREDRDFHTIQMVETAFAQYQLLRGQSESAIVLIAAVRYLAAHSPTVRAQGQVYQIAHRLSRGELLFEGD